MASSRSWENEIVMSGKRFRVLAFQMTSRRSLPWRDLQSRYCRRPGGKIEGAKAFGGTQPPAKLFAVGERE
jgi:hypothetical protein